MVLCNICYHDFCACVVHLPATVQGPIQNETNEVTEVLGMKGAAWCSTHVVADRQGNVLHPGLALDTVSQNIFK